MISLGSWRGREYTASLSYRNMEMGKIEIDKIFGLWYKFRKFNTAINR